MFVSGGRNGFAAHTAVADLLLAGGRAPDLPREVALCATFSGSVVFGYLYVSAVLGRAGSL